MENKLKKLLHYVLIPQKDFFLEDRTKTSEKEKEKERGKNVRNM